MSTFLIELLRRLEQDPTDIIRDVLIHQTLMMRNSSIGPYVPPDFSPPGHIVVINTLFYASLGVMFLAASIAMLIKSWVREFDRGLQAMSLPEQRAKTREFRYRGMERWKLSEMVGIPPLLIQLSLLLFAIGLVFFLYHISTPSFGVTAAIFGVGILYYLITTSISVFVTSSPFHSPLSRTLGNVYQHVHAYCCPHVNIFLSSSMDATPSTAPGRVRRHIQIFLRKWRPYRESDFAEPITAATIDEVQLFAAASALQRIHESALNLQHSEALQWSVWQAAGSATLRFPPLFNLPSWVFDRGNNEEYFSHLPPAVLVALVAVWLRARQKPVATRIVRVREAFQRVDCPKIPWAYLIIAIFDCVGYSFWSIKDMSQMEPNLTNMIRSKELHKDECLSTLSELRSEGWLSRKGPFWIGICQAMLLNHAPKWGHMNHPDIVLLEHSAPYHALQIEPLGYKSSPAVVNTHG